MSRLSLISACIFALFLASCGGSGGGAINTTDTDSDGIFDSEDLCENSLDENFISSSTTDHDGDGCRDSDEDDNDTILDVTDVDDDNDGLIDIATAEELNNIRHNLAGTHYNDGNSSSNAGCPTTNPVGCKGYELAQDIRLADLTGSATKNWDPIGSKSEHFTATLEGNGNTIRNLVVANNIRYSGLFTGLASGSTVQSLSFVEGSVPVRTVAVTLTPAV